MWGRGPRCVSEVPGSTLHVNERRGETARIAGHRRLRRRLRVGSMREPRVLLGRLFGLCPKGQSAMANASLLDVSSLRD